MQVSKWTPSLITDVWHIEGACSAARRNSSRMLGASVHIKCLGRRRPVKLAPSDSLNDYLLEIFRTGTYLELEVSTDDEGRYSWTPIPSIRVSSQEFFGI